MGATISIVIPTKNRREYLAANLASILSQQYPLLEVVVIDGGSDDGTVDLLEAHSSDLTWVSEQDDGPWDAVNKGFARTSGEVMAWIGSDDMLVPWALGVVGDIFESLPTVEWVTTAFPLFWDRHGRAVRCERQLGYSSRSFFAGRNLPMGAWVSSGFIQQESTFWRRPLWDRAGGKLNDRLQLAADFDLWARFHAAGAHLHVVTVPLAGFRIHGNQKSQEDWDLYREEALAVLREHGGAIPGRVESSFRWQLKNHWPLRVARLGERLGILTPQKVIDYVYAEDGWVVTTQFV